MSRRLASSILSAVGLFVFPLIPKASAVETSDTCVLPQHIQQEVATKFPRTRLLTLSDLNDDDKSFFQQDHGDACPGLVRVDFYGDGKPTLALLLITTNKGKRKVELIVCHQVGKRWTTTMLDTVDAVPAPVVWSQPPGQYHDAYGTKDVEATRPVVVVARYESWAILYAWTGSGVAKISLKD